MSGDEISTLWIDVSFWDRNRRGSPLDWDLIKAATSGVMCARATYGDPNGFNRASPYFAEMSLGAARAAYAHRGAYHNLIHGDAASHMRQADWLESEADKVGSDWAMADIEHYPELVSNGLWPRWEDVLRFRDAWWAKPRMPMTWYLPQWVVNNYMPNADGNELPGLLIQSHYSGGDGTPLVVPAPASGRAPPASAAARCAA